MPGCSAVEATSFVSPKWVPQMADAAAGDGAHPAQARRELSGAGAQHEGPGGRAGCGREEIAAFSAATETFSQRNTNCSIAESLERFAPVCKAALDAG